MRRLIFPLIALLATVQAATSARLDAAGNPAAATQSLSQPLSGTQAVLLRGVSFQGNTVFSSGRLTKELSGYVGKRVTADQLDDARIKLTRLYVDNGYITSGVVLPDQDVDPADAVVLFKIVEGKLQPHNVALRGVDAGNRDKSLWLRPGFIIDRIMAGAAPILNINRLKDRLELLRENPNIKRINAELEPGVSPGDSRLNVLVEEQGPFHFGSEFANDRPPSVGSERLQFFGSCTDVTRNGDSLDLRYTLLKGTFSDMELAGVDEYSVDYALPLNAADTALEISFERDDLPVVEPPFDQDDISSRTASVFVDVSQPIFRTVTPDFDYRELKLFAGLGYKENDSKVMGEPFSFGPGAVNGRTVVSPFRFGQELNLRNQSRAVALRSTFTFGTDAFDATQHGGQGVDCAHFFSWLGQFQYVWQLPSTDTQLIFRVAGQAANDPLPSLEQFGLGGMSTVRGYRENELLKDDAFATTLELRVPLLHRAGASILELAPFVDVGGAKDFHETPSDRGEILSSAGVGLLFHPNDKFSATIYYGYPFKDTHQTSDLQDIGIHFDLVLNLF